MNECYHNPNILGQPINQITSTSNGIWKAGKKLCIK